MSVSNSCVKSFNGKSHIWAIEISRYVGTRSRSSEAHARLTRSASRRRARSLARAATANASERGGENGDRERKGGDRSQQQAARRAADVEEKRATGRAGDAEDKRKAGRAGDVEDKRGAEQSSGVARGAAARRRRGQDDAASIAATATISRFSSVRDRVDKAKGMTVLQAIPLNIYTLRTLRSDESAGYITLGRTSDISARDTDGDDLRSAGIWMDVDDFFMSNPMDDFSD